MNLLKSFRHTCSLVVALLFYLPATAQETGLETIYGREEKEVYLANKVKEFYVEADHYYDGKLIRPRFVSDYYLIDANGQMVQRMYAHNGKLTGKIVYEYSSKGVLEVSTSFERSTDASRDTTWRPSSQHRYVKAGKKAPGQYKWDVAAGKWVELKADLTWTKNDTTFIEEQTGSSDKSKSISRYYLLGADPTVLRHDHVKFSPKGMSEPSYYYTKTENGRVVESGEMDFEMEVMAYLQQHPEANRLLFTKYGFYPVMDKIARHSSGRRVPTRTYVYNAQGQLMQEKGYTNVTYTRDASGRVVTKTSDEGIITSYYYNANGLLEGQVSLHGDGRPYESKFYSYRFATAGPQAANKTYSSASKQPSFWGGQQAVDSYFAKALAKVNREQGGVITLSLVVSATGQVSEATIVDSYVSKEKRPLEMNKKLEDALLKAALAMPGWRPVESNNKPVPIKITIPVNISDLAVAPEKEIIYSYVEQMPSFSGGQQAMFEFIGANIKYPKDAVDQNKEGTVIVNFVVGQTGELRDFKIQKGVTESIDAEAIRVLKAMPAWIPGKQNGRIVSVYYTIPLKFFIPKSGEAK